MLCEDCANIPLDLFLPKQGSSRWFKNGKAWKEAIVYREGPNRVSELSNSAKAGCPMCKIFLAALGAAEPLWAIGEFTSRGHDKVFTHGPLQKSPSEQQGPSEEEKNELISLRVRNEGEMVIADGKRTGGLYWEMESLGYGQRLDPISDRADGKECIGLALEWLETCMSEHKMCGADIDKQFVPSRLIRIGDDEHGNLQPQLVDINSWESTAQKEVNYFTLSYCWGTDRGKTVAKTTRQTLPQFLEWIPLEALPKTFQDAMLVVRRLDYRYIWIDSLCIVQDDPADFGRECAMMGEIYANALCTISASDSPDGDRGCFIPRDTAATKPCTVTLKNRHIPYQPFSIMDVVFCRFENDPEEAEVTIYPNFGPWIKGIESGPTFQRGWCLQERELSSRVLHYTQNRLMWECRECNASEDKRTMQLKTSTSATGQKEAAHLSSLRAMDDKTLQTTFSNTQNKLLLNRDKWRMLAEAYSRRQLSVKTDKLLAISGLASALARLRPGDEYLAGIWRGDLLKGLAWIPVRSSPRKLSNWPPAFADLGIPSWSWASHDGEIQFCGDSWFSSSWTKVIGDDGKEKYIKKRPETEAVSAAVQHVHPEDIFGRVNGGELTLSGWQVQLTVSEENVMEMETTPKLHCKQYYDPTHNAIIYFDNGPEALPAVDALLLQLGTGKNIRGASTSAENGLVLLPTEGGVYRRVGLFDVDGDKTAWHQKRTKGEVIIV